MRRLTLPTPGFLSVLVTVQSDEQGITQRGTRVVPFYVPKRRKRKEEALEFKVGDRVRPTAAYAKDMDLPVESTGTVMTIGPGEFNPDNPAVKQWPLEIKWDGEDYDHPVYRNWAGHGEQLYDRVALNEVEVVS